MYNAAAALLEPNLRAGRGEKIAFIDDDRVMSYAELAERVHRCAGAFIALGIPRGERIVLGLVDSVSFPIAFLGAIEAGIVPVPINTLFRASDCAYVLAHSNARAAIVSDELVDAYREGAREAAWAGRIIVANARDGSRSEFDGLLDDATPIREAAATHENDPCFWLYSSGSTGKPKGTVHRHASLMQTADLFGRGVLGMHEGDIVYSAAKLFFAYGLGNALTFPLAVGATSVLHVGRPTPERVLDVLARSRATIFCGVPTLFGAMLASEWLRETALPALRICTSAGESLPRHVGEAWRAATGVDIVDGIGSTEMLHIFLSTRPREITYGVTGRPVPGYRVRLIGENGEDAGPGELGELLVSGPSAFLEYWNDPQRSARAMLGEWVRTGDKFLQTPAGDFVHCGRTDDMIKAGGIWVAPSEVEAALIAHAAVLEVAVIGVDDALGLMKPKAFVVLRAGFVASESLERELQAFVKDRLAPYKYPRWIEFVDDVPKTATGKIRRHVLRDREAERRASSEPSIPG